MTELFMAELILIIFTVFAIIAAITAIGSLIVRVPYVPTPKRVIKKMIDLAKLKGHETVYDLGCGDARLLIAAHRRAPGITAIGYELPLGVWLYAKIRVFFSKQPVQVRIRDLFTADLRDADVVFTYLLPELMPKLKKKFDEELKEGAVVISHGFEIKEKEHEHMERVELPFLHFMRPKGQIGPRVFVYRW